MGLLDAFYQQPQGLLSGAGQPTGGILADLRARLRPAGPAPNPYGGTFPERVSGLAGALGQTWPARMAQSAWGALTLPGTGVAPSEDAISADMARQIAAMRMRAATGR